MVHSWKLCAKNFKPVKGYYEISLDNICSKSIEKIQVGLNFLWPFYVL